MDDKVGFTQENPCINHNCSQLKNVQFFCYYDIAASGVQVCIKPGL